MNKIHKHVCSDCHKKVKCWLNYCNDKDGPKAYLCDDCGRVIMKEILNDPNRPRIINE